MPDDAAFKVTCPCCGALLTLDEKSHVVTDHEVAQGSGEKASFDVRLKTLETEKRISEEKFQESIRAVKSKKDVLERKFQDLFQKAKDSPAGPVKRDIDLD